MSIREPDNSQLRDNLLAKLLGESLAPSSSAAGAACPDGETIAAYAERSLAPEETARLDVHFADCAHCQTILAAFARSLEALPAISSAELPGAELPTLANIPPPNMKRSPALPGSAAEAARSSTGTSKIRTMPPPRPTRWRELAPALGIAAAVALWFALRPTPPTQNLSAQLRTDAETSATQPPVAPPPAANNSEIAEANIPTSPAPFAATPSRTAPASSSPRESQQLSADSLKSEDSLDDVSKKAKQTDEAANAGALATSGTLSAGAAPQNGLQASQAQAAPSAPPAVARDGATRQTNSAELRAPLGGAAPKASPQPSEPGAGGALPLVLTAPNAERAKAAVAIDKLTAPATVTNTGDLQVLSAQQPSTFASPNGAVTWRTSARGSIERSTDRGQTWEKQVSGVFSDLVSGSAPSDKVAWIVGRAGVILRTTDGTNWQRVLLPNGAASVSATTAPAVASPSQAQSGAVPVGSGGVGSSTAASAARNASTVDLARVEARDAFNATVISAGGRRFTTSDGGQTWTSQ